MSYKVCGTALSTYVINALVAMCIPVVSGCVSVSHHVNETWSVVLVSLGSGMMCDVARYRIRALRKVMSLRFGGQQLFSLSYSRNGIP